MTKSKNKRHFFTPAEIDAFDHMRTGLTAKGAAIRAKTPPVRFIALAKSTFPDRLELERIPSRKDLLAFLAFLAVRSSKVTAVTTVCFRCRGPKTTRGSLCDICSGKASLRERWEADHAFQT